MLSYVTRKIIFLNLFLLIIFSNSHCFSQDSLLSKKFVLNCKKCDLEEIFKSVERNFDLYLSYPSKIVDLRKTIKFKYTYVTLKEILDSLIKSNDLTYSIIEKQIIIKKNPVINIDSAPFLRIQAQVLEINSNIPIAYAHVSIVKKPIVTITNNDGFFLLILPYKYINDTLVITCIGYKSLYIPIKDIIQKNTLYLIPDVIPINEVIIRRNDPIYLINKAISLIQQNYPTKDFIQTGFYRETIKKHNEIVSLTEAIIKCYRKGYSDFNYFLFDNDKIKIEKGRKFISNNIKDSLILKLKGGLQTILFLDLIKNPPEFLDETKENNYDFFLNDILFNGNEELYEIIFRQKEYIKKSLYNGKMYIDVKNMAITKVNFSLNDKNIEKEWYRFVLKKPDWVKIKPQKAEYTVIYSQINNKYYPLYAASLVDMKIGNKKSLFQKTYSYIIEAAFMEIDTLNVKPFSTKEIINTSIILENIIDKYEDDYWGKYNFIPPDESLLNIINSFLSQKNQ